MSEVIACAVLACDEKTTIMLLSKMSIDMLSTHFNEIFFNIFMFRSIDCFESLIQRLKACSRLLMSSDILSILSNESDLNCLMVATARTHHFLKLIECYDKEDLELLLHQRDARGFDCLFHACKYDNIEVVQYLLTNFEYDLSTVNEVGCTVIIYLACNSNISILQYLFDHRKADAIAACRIITEKGSSFLRTICFIGCSKLLSFFMKRQENSPPLLSQIFPFPEYTKHILDCIMIGCSSTETKAKYVAKRLINYIVDTIIEENMPLNDCFIRGSNGQTLLMVATICTDTLQSLLHLADAQNVLSELLAETDVFGNSILAWACTTQNLDSLKLLITQYNLDWRADMNFSVTKLIYQSCGSGNFEVEIPQTVFPVDLFVLTKKRFGKLTLNFCFWTRRKTSLMILLFCNH